MYSKEDSFMVLVVATSNVITWPDFWRSATNQISFKVKYEKLASLRVAPTASTLWKFNKNESSKTIQAA